MVAKSFKQSVDDVDGLSRYISFHYFTVFHRNPKSYIPTDAAFRNHPQYFTHLMGYHRVCTVAYREQTYDLGVFKNNGHSKIPFVDQHVLKYDWHVRICVGDIRHFQTHFTCQF